jgi:tRNA modification GTPase
VSATQPIVPPLSGLDDTIAAIATARGRGALSMVRLTGPRAHEVAERLLRPWRPEARSAWLAAVHHPQTGDLVDRGIALVYRAPSSYTAEDMVEITVHGGHLVSALVLEAALDAGAREALPGEFTRRAVLHGRMDLLQAEAVAELIDAGTRAMHGAALRQLDGSLSRRLSGLRDEILQLEALIAYDIDFPEEDDGPVAPDRVREQSARVLKSLDELLATKHTGEVVRQGAAVVIAGPPNAGKSSLFNALVGAARAIVTDVPGTTRDAIEALIEVHGWPVRLVDTAGLRDSSDTVERIGIEVSERWLERAELVLVCADDPTALAEAVARVGELSSAPRIELLTKVDGGGDISAHREAPLAVSAHSGAGLDALTHAIASRLDAAFADPAGELPLLIRDRHHKSVESARREVAQFAQSAQSESAPAVVAAVHLRAAALALEELIGTVDVEDVLDRVFSSFCIGK